MKILFLGYAVNQQLNYKLSGRSDAGNKFELGILKELNSNVEKLDVITIYPIAAFPKDKAAYKKGKYIDIGYGLKSYRVGFCNIPFIKQITQILTVYKHASEIIENNEDTIVVPFNMYPQTGLPAIFLKKKYDCRVVPILADLPIDDNYNRQGIGKVVRFIFNSITAWTIKQMDEVIVLNKYAHDVFAPQSDYIVVDGGLEPQGNILENPKTNFSDGKKHIVYTGSLAEYSGIVEMVKAMDLVHDEDIVLDIYGGGGMEKWIAERAGGNVCFHGRVSNSDAIGAQRAAWLLVNPRRIEDEIAKVTFPSKIFEYMYSGTPALSTRLNGFTPEYEDKLFFAENNKPETLARAVASIAALPERELLSRAQRAKKYVESKKNWAYQVRRILSFLNGAKMETV